LSKRRRMEMVESQAPPSTISSTPVPVMSRKPPGVEASGQ